MRACEDAVDRMDGSGAQGLGTKTYWRPFPYKKGRGTTSTFVEPSQAPQSLESRVIEGAAGSQPADSLSYLLLPGAPGQGSWLF